MTTITRLASEGGVPERPEAAAGGEFESAFDRVFAECHPVVFRIVDRMCGDPELAADIAQEALVRLFGRGSMPDKPSAWLVTVALNLLRNARGKRSRRLRLLDATRAEHVRGDPPVPPSRAVEAEETRLAVRSTLDALTHRERALLLLAAEGYTHAEIAAALGLRAVSAGKLLSRAREAFTNAYRTYGHG